MSGKITVAEITRTEYKVELKGDQIRLIGQDEVPILVGLLNQGPETYDDYPARVTVYEVRDSVGFTYTVASARLRHGREGAKRAYHRYQTTVEMHCREYTFLQVQGLRVGDVIIGDDPFDDRFSNGTVTIPLERPEMRRTITIVDTEVPLCNLIPALKNVTAAMWDRMLDLVPGRTIEELTEELFDAYLSQDHPFRVARVGTFVTNGAMMVYCHHHEIPSGFSHDKFFANVNPKKWDFLWQHLVGKTWREVDQAAMLHAVNKEHPFYRESTDMYLTNGDFRLPLLRPIGPEWAMYPEILEKKLKSILSDEWDLLIEVLEGRLLSDISWEDILSEVHAKVKARERARTARLFVHRERSNQY